MSTGEQREREAEPEAETEAEPDRVSGAARAKARNRYRRRTERREPPALDETETVHLRVYRYDPEVQGKAEPRYDDFHVPMEPGLTVLDALIYARDHFDSTLTFRHSCRQAICGSDAFLINGTQGLGCQQQIDELAEPVRIEPLPYFDVVKDLVVEMDEFYEQMHGIEPYFQSSESPPGELEERRQSRENREDIKMAARCIWCASCSSSCSIYGQGDNYVGPAAINYAYRFIVDERESEDVTDHRLRILEQPDGVWRCQTQFSCTEVCPKDIPITQEIQDMKREAVKRNLTFW